MPIKYFFLSFVICLALVPFVKKLAVKLNVMDKPNARKQHLVAKPLLGGLAVYFGTFLSYMIYVSFRSSRETVLLWGIGFLLVLMGIYDDKYDLNAFVKLFFQLLIAFLAAYVIGGIARIDIYSYTIYLSTFNGIIAMTLWIVALINAFNLIDGLDGLSAGAGLISFATIVIVSILGGNTSNMVMLLIFCGSLLGFLFYNFYPATIFLGDAGAMFIGFAIAIISTNEYKTVTTTSMVLIFLIAFLPVMDTILSFVRRKINGEKVFKADALHFHHRLLRQGYSQQQAVLIMYSFMIIYASVAILISTSSSLEFKLFLIFSLFCLTIFIVEKFYLLSRRHAYFTKLFIKMFSR